MTISREWAAFCRLTAASPLPERVARHTALCVADHLHAAMHGADTATGRLVRAYLGPTMGSADAPAMGEPFAFYSGALSAIHEIDDVHRDTSLHPGSVVVAAALATGGLHPTTGPRLLAAVAAGYEIAVRLSIAAGHRHYHYFHATPTCASVGAAAAASMILDLDETQTAHAIGAAVAQAGGLWEGINDEAVTIKHLHPGWGAERGVRAARLALLGLVSAERSIDGDKGFLAALAQRGPHAPTETPTRESLDATLLDGLSERWIIERNIFKRYPFCLGCFEPLEGLRAALLAAKRPVSDVDSVLVELSPPTAWMVGHADPADPFAAKFSAPYALGLVLAGRNVEEAPLPDALLADPAVHERQSRVRIEANPEIRRRTSRVTVTWRDGARDIGDAPLRNLDEGEVRARFSAACGRYLGERAAALEASVTALPSAADVGGLLALARAGMRYGFAALP